MARGGANRRDRVGRSIQQVLSETLQTRSSDPRLSGLMLTRVELTRDLSVADVSWTFLSGEPTDERVRKVNEGFRAARGRLRSIVGREVRIRNVPALRFHFDRGLAHSRRIEELLEGLDTGDPSTPAAALGEDGSSEPDADPSDA